MPLTKSTRSKQKGEQDNGMNIVTGCHSDPEGSALIQNTQQGIEDNPQEEEYTFNEYAASGDGMDKDGIMEQDGNTLSDESEQSVRFLPGILSYSRVTITHPNHISASEICTTF